MEAQRHTTGRLGVAISKTGKMDYTVFICSTAGNLARMMFVDSRELVEANARRIVLTWNCHDDLLAALKAIVKEADGGWLRESPVAKQALEVIVKAENRTP